MKCPNCGSENCQYITTTETHGGGISWGDACCGTVLLGPVGILCGFCGSEVHTRTKEYCICDKNVGRRYLLRTVSRNYYIDSSWKNNRNCCNASNHWNWNIFSSER